MMGRQTIREHRLSKDRVYPSVGDFDAPKSVRKAAVVAPAAQRRRADAYDEGLSRYQSTGDASQLITCIHHPGRIVNRSGYVLYRKQICGSCKTNRRIDGTPRPARARNINTRNYRKSVERRKHFQGTLRGLKLFERATGFDLTRVGFSRKEIGGQNN